MPLVIGKREMNSKRNPQKVTPFTLLPQLYNDPERKSLVRIMGEFIYLSFAFRTIPRHYFTRYLFKKDKENFRDYFPNKFLYALKPHFNNKEVRDVLENKLFFDFFYRQFNIPLPEIVMYNHGKMFVLGKQCILVNNAKEFKDLLLRLVQERSVDEALFIKKTYASYGGRKTYKLFISQLNSTMDQLDTIYLEVIQTGYLYQRVIKQHPVLNALNPSSVNTLRIDTFMDLDGKVEFMSAHLRLSTKNLHVDNITSGGCGVSVDLETGKLNKYGYQEFKYGGINRLTENPTTKAIFEEYTIPFIDEVKEMVINVARLIPGLRLIGWDVALGETGPILVEGNSDYDISGNENQYGGYLKHPVFRKVLKEINYL